MRKSWTHGLLFVAFLAPFVGASAAGATTTITLGRSTVSLTGPWKFHTGDNLRWADSGYDDSSWESVDLGAPPEANDGDVGITPYTHGWNSKGHPGYHGYAWYRLRFAVTLPAGEDMALLGPWAVDSAYQVYVDGTLLGGVGDFSGAVPTAYGYHYPTRFALPPALASGGSMALAIRVWAGPWVGGADGGGIHVAPAIGEQGAIDARYKVQWVTIFEGYAVDVVPALLFGLMALLVLGLRPLDRGDRIYLWLPIALLLSGIQRGNQAFFFWWQIETVQGFVLVILVLVSSLSLGAWMMAWRSWFKLDALAWLAKTVAGLTLFLMLALFLSRLPVFGVNLPHVLAQGARYLITLLRLAFMLALAYIVYQGIGQRGHEGWYALPAILAIAAVLFASELSAIHVPGIWFPYGIGLSLSEIMSVVFDVLLAGLLLRRLRSYAHHSSHSEIPA